LNKKLVFPQQITTMNLRTEIVLYSAKEKIVRMIEATISWEDKVEKTSERNGKREKNTKN
jgi:hypothetical protein